MIDIIENILDLQITIWTDFCQLILQPFHSDFVFSLYILIEVCFLRLFADSVWPYRAFKPCTLLGVLSLVDGVVPRIGVCCEIFLWHPVYWFWFVQLSELFLECFYVFFEEDVFYLLFPFIIALLY